MFEVVRTITLSLEEYNRYWLYVDNIWSLKGMLRITKDDTIIDYFRCRCHSVKEHIPKIESQ